MPTLQSVLQAYKVQPAGTLCVAIIACKAPASIMLHVCVYIKQHVHLDVLLQHEHNKGVHHVNSKNSRICAGPLRRDQTRCANAPDVTNYSAAFVLFLTMNVMMFVTFA